MIYIGDQIDEDYLDVHFDGFIKRINYLFIHASFRYKLIPVFRFEKRFYRALLVDRTFARELVNITAAQLMNFETQSFYKKHRLFFLMCLDKKVRKTLPFSTHLELELKSLPKELRDADFDGVCDRVRERCVKVFSYEKFSKVKLNEIHHRDEWNAYNFINRVSVKSCPYCNFELITTLEHYEEADEDGGIYYEMRSALDHFLAKSLYPFFAVSPYNLVPSCDTCNTRLKKAKDFKNPVHMSPYEAGFDKECNFEITFNNHDKNIELINKIYTIAEIDFNEVEIKLGGNCEARLNNSANFKLAKRYNHHKDVISNFLSKLPQVHSKRFKDYGDLLSSGDTLQQICKFIGHELDNQKYKDVPLSKLKHDLLEQHCDLYVEHYRERNSTDKSQ
jgi:hypothetical protein